MKKPLKPCPKLSVGMKYRSRGPDNVMYTHVIRGIVDNQCVVRFWSRKRACHAYELMSIGGIQWFYECGMLSFTK